VAAVRGSRILGAAYEESKERVGRSLCEFLR